MRVAWSRDLGGRLPVDPRDDRGARGGSAASSRTLGCDDRRRRPDLRDADEFFHIFRAWDFELDYGELLDTVLRT